MVLRNIYPLLLARDINCLRTITTLSTIIGIFALQSQP